MCCVALPEPVSDESQSNPGNLSHYSRVQWTLAVALARGLAIRPDKKVLKFTNVPIRLFQMGHVSALFEDFPA